MDCIFCRIAQKEIPAQILYEDEQVVAFHDIHPLAPVHVLVIPRKHIASVTNLSDDSGDGQLMGRLIVVAKNIAEKLGTAQGGYKLLLRVGKDGGQEVAHIHLHLLGGGPLAEDIRLAK